MQAKSSVAPRPPRMLSMRHVLVRAFVCALVIHLLLSAGIIALQVQFGIPFRIEPNSGLVGEGSIFSFGLFLYVTGVCLLISICQVAVAWWLTRRPLQVLNHATTFVDQLPFRYGGQLDLDGSDVSEIAELINAINATSTRLAIQDEALARLEGRLKAIIDALPDHVFFKNAEGCYLVCNQAYANYLGKPELQIIGYTDAEIGNAAQTDETESAEASVVSTHSTHVARQWRTGANGLRQLIETTRSALLNNEGVLLGILGIGRDITQAVRHQQADKAHAQIFHLLAEAATLTDVLTQLAAYVNNQLGGAHCMVLTLDDQLQSVHVAAAPSLPALLGETLSSQHDGETSSFVESAIRQSLRTHVPDLAADPCWQPLAPALQLLGIHQCWVEPVISPREDVIGLVAMLFPGNVERPAEATLGALLEEAASLASVAIERCRSAVDLKLAAQVYRASNEGICVLNEQHQVIATNPAYERITGFTHSEVAGQPCTLLDTERGTVDLHAEVAAALASQGVWEGEIWSRRKSGELFAAQLTVTTTESEEGAQPHRVVLFSDITERKRSEEIIWFQANNDALTGLPNRRLFRDRLTQDVARAKRAGQRVAVLFIDLDNFKQVNDVLGHEAGDQLLVEAAKRIRGCVRTADTVARLGGDEFTVILPNFSTVGTVERICKTMLTQLAEPFQLAGEQAYISASIGVTQYPDDAEDIEELLKNADQSMYVAKRQGRNNFSWFTAQLRDAAREWHALATDLRLALEGNQFEVYFQPIIDLHTHLPVKAEALLRWHHPERGMVSPALFVPIAEEIGIIGDIGEWVFREAVRHAATWPTVGNIPVAVSINKSPRQFLKAERDQDWIEYLHETGFDPSRLIVEITEGLLLDDRGTIGTQLATLRAAGIKIAIDDFGTGYSSLSYLKKFPIDFLKIDKSFIRDVSEDLNDRALCEAIIAIANLLGLQVVAEGVETEEQRLFLYNAGGDFGQGYLFAKPMPARDFSRYLTQPRLLAQQVA